MEKLSKSFLDDYYFGSYWAFRHYGKIIGRAFSVLSPKPKVAVEVGCGVGMATYVLSKQVHHLICIDTNEDYIQKVKEMVKETGIKNVSFMKTELDKISLDRKVDLLFFKDVLHHMPSSADYLKSCLSFSNYLLVIEANRYNPLLYWVCKNLEEERQFLKMNSLHNILRIVERGGWQCEKSFYVESAAYPIGYCCHNYVLHRKKMSEIILRYVDKLYRYNSVSSMVDRAESLVEKMLTPFCSEFIIIAKNKAASFIDQ